MVNHITVDETRSYLPEPLPPEDVYGWLVIEGNRFPMIQAEVVDGDAVWWCKHCDAEHVHGATPDMWLGGALRLPHCFVRDSPYEGTSVVLIPGPPGCSSPPPRSQRRKPWWDRRRGLYRSGWSRDR